MCLFISHTFSLNLWHGSDAAVVVSTAQRRLLRADTGGHLECTL